MNLKDQIKVIAKRYKLSKEAQFEILSLIEEASSIESQLSIPVDLSTVIEVSDNDNPKKTEFPKGLTDFVQRYESVGTLGTGGMAVVDRVIDHRLDRFMAMKIAKNSIMKSQKSLQRFINEARITSQLQHPGIIPVHDFGRLEDGRYFFTMQEVIGRTLSESIKVYHHKSSSDASLRRLIEILRKTSDAVGYAHSKKIIHLDLKPANIMVGEHGAVLVLDWGLARDIKVDFFQESRRIVAGTPAYMSPEQAKGDFVNTGPQSDVYALGAILYHILSGRPPFIGKDSDEVIRQVLHTNPIPLRELLEIDAEKEGLITICEKAMCRNWSLRHSSANFFVQDLIDWLDGVKRRVVAQGIVGQASLFYPQITEIMAKAGALRSEAKIELSTLNDLASEQLKAPAWVKEDKALLLERQAKLMTVQAEQLLHAALTHDPNSSQAHTALANRYKRQHQAAEKNRDFDAMTRAETMLRAHVSSMNENSESRSEHFAYLSGYGSLSIDTNPRGAEVLLHRYELNNRRLRPTYVRCLGKTPLVDQSLPMGSYLLLIRANGYQEVRYPVNIGRQQVCDGTPPYQDEPLPISLPPKGLLSDHECYIPAGWYLSGGDSDAMSALPRRKIWLDGFVMSRFPVTNSEYLSFLNYLLEEGLENDAMIHAPRESTRFEQAMGSILYGRTANGLFCLKKDQDGDLWLPNWPVLRIGWHNACAYAAHKSQQTGFAWRLPDEFEWEKSARGVDGRRFPWGDFLDPSWACIRRSHSGRMLPSSISDFPVDVSPFGVFGLGGNARDWTRSPYLPQGPEVSNGLVVSTSTSDASLLDETFYTVKGGSWYDQERFSRICSRTSQLWHRGNANLSCRFVRALNW